MKITDLEFIEYEKNSGVSYENPDYINLMRSVYNVIDSLPNISNILEIGCGIATLGYIINKDNKYNYIGIDPNVEHIKEANKYNVDILNDYSTLENKKYSLGVSIEVFEHLTDDIINEYLNIFSFDYFIFSSTPYYNNEPYNEYETFDIFWGHINIKTESEWIELFGKYGYILDRKLNTPTSWALLFKKYI